MSRLKLATEAKQAGLSHTWSKTPKTGFLMTELMYIHAVFNVFFLWYSVFTLKIKLYSVYNGNMGHSQVLALRELLGVRVVSELQSGVDSIAVLACPDPLLQGECNLNVKHDSQPRTSPTMNFDTKEKVHEPPESAL